jgi:hypothetical protein
VRGTQTRGCGTVSWVTGHVHVREVQATPARPHWGRRRSERPDPPVIPTGQQIAHPAQVIDYLPHRKTTQPQCPVDPRTAAARGVLTRGRPSTLVESV